ncbi:MAG: Efg1 domain-containing protein, partial [archaeon]|nr:Efg1 domain-containing protein [archaeon]
MGKKFKKEKITKESILEKMKFNFSRDAEWFKKTNKKIEQIKEELNKNFYSEERKKEKIDFIHKLKAKIKDYLDAVKFEQKYKSVRFVERRKLERKLTQINKKLEGNKEDKELLEEKQKIIDDINYVKFYPKTYKYYALFPNKDAENPTMIEK